MSTSRGRLRPRKAGKSIKHVQSGIGLSSFDKKTGGEQSSFVTSRTARVLLAGAGFLADAYDLFVINLVLRLLRDEYPEYSESGRLHLLEGSVASAALIGAILGQLVAGSLADIVGRKKIFVATAGLIAIGSFGSACSLDTPFLTIYGQICCWRFFLGAGVGGEYPLAATVTSESSSAGKRGSLMCAVFAMQGVGSLLSGIIVFLCLLLGFSTAFTWRFALAFGAIPALIAFPYRLRMHETESFERLKKERLHDSLLISSNNNPNEYVEKNPITYIDGPSTTIQYDELFPLTGNDNNNHNSNLPPKHSLIVDSSSKDEEADIIIESEEDSPATSLGKLSKYRDNDIEYDHLNTVATSTTSVIFEKSLPIRLSSTTHNPSTENTPLLSFNTRKHSNSIDSLDYGQHYEINSRNNSNTEYLQHHLNRRDNSSTTNTNSNNNTSNNNDDMTSSSYQTFDTPTNNNTNYNRGNFHINNNNNNTTTSLLPPTTITDIHTPSTVSSSITQGKPHNSNSHIIPLIHNPLHKTRFTELIKALTYYRYHILGTSLCWFLLDIVFYANGLFNHEITSMILTSSNDNINGKISKTSAKQDAINSMIISCIAIPGYILSIFYIEYVGRKNIQMLGFMIISILFFICGYGYDILLGINSGIYGKYLFLLIYSLTFLFSNFGPNTTTFVIPGEIYPSEVRATCHGFSAACGKLGAATGAYFFPLILGPQGSSHPTKEGMISAMYICSIIAIGGFIVTYLFIPRYDGKMLETINETGNTYLKLEHNCLWPSYEALEKLEEENRRYHCYNNPVGGINGNQNSGNSNNSFEMLQVIHASDDYSIHDVEIAGNNNTTTTPTTNSNSRGIVKK